MIRLRNMGAAALLILAGCSTFEPKNTPISEDLDGLEMLMSDDFNMIYGREGETLSSYTAVNIRPVVFMGNEEAFEKVEADDRERLKQLLHDELREELSEHFAVTDDTGPEVLDIEVHVTNLNPSSPLTNVASTATVRFSIDVGQAAMHGFLRDSVSEDLLVAVKDEAAGRRFVNYRNFVSKWRDVEHIFGTWAEDITKLIVKSRKMMAEKASQ